MKDVHEKIEVWGHFATAQTNTDATYHCTTAERIALWVGSGITNADNSGRAASVKQSPENSSDSQLSKECSHARRNPTPSSEQPKETSQERGGKKQNTPRRGKGNNPHVVVSVVKTEGEVESDDECVESVFRFHVKLQE